MIPSNSSLSSPKYPVLLPVFVNWYFSSLKSPENSPYVIEYQGKKYDLVEAREQDDFDAGYIQYPKSKITGHYFVLQFLGDKV